VANNVDIGGRDFVVDNFDVTLFLLALSVSSGVDQS
jgi:hypothetical protein